MLVESYRMPKNENQKSWLSPPALALNVRTLQVCPDMNLNFNYNSLATDLKKLENL